ncbi:acyltransferase [Halomonas huangheensis]|uniref:Phospholipid/glycerol acyltransferase domain-containing protein n=1 Tax=Halomonas huangheensis TaxID=1178482 RepID=W1NBH0_9GAMM|nr:acyltransferase [Halomonas huangheensis]ALM52665.1 acyltransferase [Halomonas huangheensis]ERL52813.1 hypothetical protein BJB45_16170 [Halomonas huangheensis]
MSNIKGLISVLLLILNTLFWTPPLLCLTLIKVVTPGRPLQRRILAGLNAIALNWIGFNLWWMKLWVRPSVHLEVPEELSPQQWWLVLSNHRSWTDIFLLMMAFHRRIPMPRFFLKQQLIWIPIVGLAWWALEYPFMRRYTREQLNNNPALAERDRKATERMCERARDVPLSIINFVEGTRFTQAKRNERQSPYSHLLRPKAGGIAQVLSLLGDRLAGIIDVTIDYQSPKPSFWRFLCGREQGIRIEARTLEIEDWMLDGTYHNDSNYKERYHSWLNALWREKDASLDSRPW